MKTKAMVYLQKIIKPKKLVWKHRQTIYSNNTSPIIPNTNVQ